MNPEPETPDARDYVRLILRRGWILLLCMILVPLAAYEYTASKPKIFQARTVLQIQSGVDTAISGTDTSTPAANLNLVAALVSTSAVADEAARQLGLPEGSLRGAASASADPDTGFVTITATSNTSQRAAQVATAFADALNNRRKAQGIQRVDQAIAAVQDQLKNTPKADATTRFQLRSQLERLQTLKQAQGQNASVIEPARRGAQTAPHPRRNATVGLILGILIGVALIALVENMDRRLRKPEEVESLTGLPLLATIPHDAFPGGRETTEVHESFQTLRASLTYFNADQTLKTVLVVSGLKAEGKTTVATNLAMAYASSGKRVILVDADLRKPDAAERMHTEGGLAGLSQVLAGEVTLDSVMREVEPFGAALRVLPAGAIPPNPQALLGSLRMASLTSELEQDADVVVIDTTPLLHVSDAFPLLDRASGIVALVRLDQTPRDAVRRMLKVINSANGNLLGLVVTDQKRTLGYGYGYGYGYGDKRAQSVPPPAAAAEPLDTAPGGNGRAPVPAAGELQEPRES